MFNVVVEIKAPEITEAIWALIGTLANTKIEGAPVQMPTVIPAFQQAQQEKPQQVETQQPVQVTYPEQQYATLGYAAQPLQQQPQQASMQQAPVQQQPMQPQQPLQPVQMQPQQTLPATAVPTTAPTYSVEQLAVAATQLMDAGRKNELVALLGSFGVQALTMLPKEQYGNFATQLRAMGAKI